MQKKSKNQKPKNIQPQPNAHPREEEIRLLAYQLFCESGYQHGKDQEHWLEAERRVLGDSGSNEEPMFV